MALWDVPEACFFLGARFLLGIPRHRETAPVTVVQIGPGAIAGNIMTVRQFGASDSDRATVTVPGHARIDCVFQALQSERSRRGLFIRWEIRKHRIEKVRLALGIAGKMYTLGEKHPHEAARKLSEKHRKSSEMWSRAGKGKVAARRAG
jgi:hypothetical protein